jgi:uncharacterized protein YfaS (alpha-2-macroglobulin family)
MNINSFQAGETVGIWAFIKDWEGTYTSPDNGVKVTLTDPEGTVKVNASAMTEDDDGKFVYYYNSEDDDVKGWWRYSCKSQDGTGDEAKYVITEGSFELK